MRITMTTGRPFRSKGRGVDALRETFACGSLPVSPENLDYMDIFYHFGNLDLLIRHIQDDVVLPHSYPGHAGEIGQLVTVLVPYLRQVVQMLVSLPKKAIVYRAIRPIHSA